jgi:hypothetical protein
MKKFIIEDNEIQRILSLHKVMKEQTTPQPTTNTTSNKESAFLRDAESKGCISGGDVYGPVNGKHFYRTTTKQSKKQIDFFSDMTYSFVDGSKSGTWTCKNLVQTQGQTDVLRTTTESNILKQYRDMGAKTESELAGEEKTFWVPVNVGQRHPKEFPQGLTMYFDPKVLNDPNSQISKEINKSVTSRIPEDQKKCKEKINEYYTNYMRKRPMSPSEFDSLKYQTQACKNEFYKNWDPFAGGRRLNKILDIMSGGQGGPSRRGEDAKWRLS